VAVTSLRTKELLLKALAVELKTPRPLAVAAYLLIRYGHFLSFLFIY
jgi:hypothetical protein